MVGATKCAAQHLKLKDFLVECLTFNAVADARLAARARAVCVRCLDLIDPQGLLDMACSA